MINFMIALLITISPHTTFVPNKIELPEGRTMVSQDITIEIYETKIVIRNKETLFQKTFFIEAFCKGKEKAHYFCDRYEIEVFHNLGNIYKMKIDGLTFIKEES